MLFWATGLGRTYKKKREEKKRDKFVYQYFRLTFLLSLNSACMSAEGCLIVYRMQFLA